MKSCTPKLKRRKVRRKKCKNKVVNIALEEKKGKEKVFDYREERKLDKKPFLAKVDSPREIGIRFHSHHPSKGAIEATYLRSSGFDGCSSSKRVRRADFVGSALTHISHFDPEVSPWTLTPPEPRPHKKCKSDAKPTTPRKITLSGPACQKSYKKALLTLALARHPNPRHPLSPASSPSEARANND